MVECLRSSCITLNSVPTLLKKCRVGMPESVPAKSRFDSQFPSCWSQIFVQNCLLPNTAVLHGYAGSQIPSPPAAAIGRMFFPLDQRFADEGMDRHRLLRRFRFARSYESVDDGTRHVDCSR